MPVIKTNKQSIAKAAGFFLREIHSQELDGDIQKAVINYRNGNITYERALEFMTEMFYEELEQWVVENKVLSLQLKSIQDK